MGIVPAVPGRVSESGSTKRRPAAAAAGRPPRRERADRAQLIDAAIEALSAAGPRGLTSVRVARAAGLAQSGFYRYFRNPDDCVRAAADAITDRLRALHAELWRTMLTADPADVDANARYYEAWLGTVLEDRRVAELLFRHRHDQTPFGRAMRRHLDLMRGDLSARLVQIAARVRVPSGNERAIALLAELLLAEALGLCECLLEDPRRDVGLVARTLARSAVEATTSLLARLLRGGEQAPARQDRPRRRAPRREPPPADARARLLAAAIRVLRRDGPGGLTTVSVTREAGIVQSGFYRHFKDVAACERAAAREVAVDFRRINRERRQQLLAADPTDLERTTAYYEGWLATAVGENRRLTELYFQYRREATPLGKVAREFERAARADVAAWLSDLGARLGLEARHADAITLQADLLWASAAGMCEALIAGRATGVGAVARLLAEHAIAESAHAFKRAAT